MEVKQGYRGPQILWETSQNDSDTLHTPRRILHEALVEEAARISKHAPGQPAGAQAQALPLPPGDLGKFILCLSFSSVKWA